MANPFSLRLNDKTKAAAQKKAQQNGQTLNGYVRKLVEEDLKPPKKTIVVGESKEEIVLKVSSAPKKIVILVEEETAK